MLANTLLGSAFEITHENTLVTHKDSVRQVLTALKDEAQMRPTTLSLSNAGQMLTEVLSRSIHHGWTRYDYDQARSEFEKTHKPDEKMTDLLDHGLNVSQMIYTGNYPHTANIFYDLITSLSEIKAGI